jgi:hypothetical protein
MKKKELEIYRTNSKTLADEFREFKSYLTIRLDSLEFDLEKYKALIKNKVETDTQIKAGLNAFDTVRTLKNFEDRIKEIERKIE